MSTKPRELLHRLFEYIEEQLKQADPRGFVIGKSLTPRFFQKDLAALPGVAFDVTEPGDHIWLKVDRLEANHPPAVASEYAHLIRFTDDPAGAVPHLDELEFARVLHEAKAEKDEALHEDIENELRTRVDAALVGYTSHWQEWAAIERPRRRSISLYGDLFALKHQLQAEQTANPIEFVWGLGIASWTLSFEDKPFDFQYPLLTQPLEIALDDNSMALEVRPRATDPRCEMDAFVGVGVLGAADCEKAMREHIARHRETPVSPFSPSSYADVLKLAARNLDSRGTYVEVLSAGKDAPAAGEHLVVSDSWVLFARPKSNNFLVEDLKNIRHKLEEGCDIPAGPLALVSPPSNVPISYEAVNFRGLSGRGTSSGPSGGSAPQELYFPLPYNQEQVTIVQRLERAAGVTVQGPPGTTATGSPFRVPNPNSRCSTRSPSSNDRCLVPIYQSPELILRNSMMLRGSDKAESYGRSRFVQLQCCSRKLRGREFPSALQVGRCCAAKIDIWATYYRTRTGCSPVRSAQLPRQTAAYGCPTARRHSEYQ
ncbi:hypothetical protein [Paraburkholderia sp. GAS334]|uniref:hypothetical protein n=1 Tax=Paraburkholderia sp. GAS334 TaxID=3035131 RepID=UPI003D24BA48